MVFKVLYNTVQHNIISAAIQLHFLAMNNHIVFLVHSQFQKKTQNIFI